MVLDINSFGYKWFWRPMVLDTKLKPFPGGGGKGWENRGPCEQG
jgi:hypothetical protein